MIAAFADSLFRLGRPIIHASDAEAAHSLTLTALAAVPRASCALTSPALRVRLAGVDFPNPVGLAAGFDKDGMVPHIMPHFGFGFCEIGTLTPLPQAGNDRPRLFRLVADQAVINRLGFNNGGQAAAARRLAARRAGPTPLGINIGANKDAVAAGTSIADYCAGVRVMGPLADYLTINISSPNTPGLRALQDAGALGELLAAVGGARGELARPVPLFLKVAPDLAPADIDAVVRAALAHGIDALIVANTTVTRPPLTSADAGEAGGLSGAPLRDLAFARLVDFRAATGGSLPLIAVGGIGSAADAWARVRAGASLVQIYSALVFAGPGVAGRIAAGLAELAARDGFVRIADAIGVDAAAAT